MAWPWVATWLKHLPNDITPLVFRARDSDGLVALALLVDTHERGLRRILGGRSMLLQETGDTDLDGITIEYAGLLVRHGREQAGYKALFDTLASTRHWHKLLVSATSHANAIAAALPQRMRAFSLLERPSYFVDLAAVRADGGDYLACLGSSTRYGLRRTRRAYEAHGPIRLDIATDPVQALAWLEELRVLHERYWHSKGKRGSFGSAFFAAFHEDLVRETAGGFTHLLRIMAGDLVVGYLYNLVWRGRLYFYNAGLNYGALEKQDRPGFLAHMVAIEKYLRDGMELYDFLAGDGDYKRLMSTHARTVHWIQVRRPGWRLSLEVLLARAGRRGLGVPLVPAAAGDVLALRD
jgi:CelD/BcsL family acetyltransferase involved in cellulose biosynthesis